MTVRFNTLVLAVVLAASFTALLIVGYLGFLGQGLAQLAGESHGRLTLFVSSLRGELEKFAYLPALLARDRHLHDALRSKDPWTLGAANRFLETAAATAGASDIYLMTRRGDTIAASNWNLDRSFVGENFSFRPYFEEAARGGSGRYFALGTTSNQRGFYFSHPVSFDREIRGVVAVKVDLAEIEQSWADRGSVFVVTDADGVVFLTTRPDWHYAAIGPLSAADLGRIRASRRYAGADIHPLRLTPVKNIGDGARQVLIGEPGQRRGESFLMQSVHMPAAGWTVHILADTRIILDGVVLRTALTGFGALIVVLLASLYLVNRQRQKALVFARDRLEQRVAQRTRELSAEVEERRRTEETLLRTQAELIQTAKMAGLGQISAGISHELNQPITAIRTYTENARRMLARGRHEELAGNLSRITELTGKMSGIITLLRDFSGKSRGERKTLSVREAVEQAIGMFHRELGAAGIDVDVDVTGDLLVHTDPLLLNQVLVNLASNAIHAVTTADRGWIRVSAREAGGFLEIDVEDNGPGISMDVIDNVFDPFFTTKEVGLGLGLGLSISYRIMTILGGGIEAGNRPGAGAHFTLRLPAGLPDSAGALPSTPSTSIDPPAPGI